MLRDYEYVERGKILLLRIYGWITATLLLLLYMETNHQDLNSPLELPKARFVLYVHSYVLLCSFGRSGSLLQHKSQSINIFRFYGLVFLHNSCQLVTDHGLTYSGWYSSGNYGTQCYLGIIFLKRVRIWFILNSFVTCIRLYIYT